MWGPLSASRRWTRGCVRYNEAMPQLKGIPVVTADAAAPRSGPPCFGEGSRAATVLTQPGARQFTRTAGATLVVVSTLVTIATAPTLLYFLLG